MGKQGDDCVEMENRWFETLKLKSGMSASASRTTSIELGAISFICLHNHAAYLSQRRCMKMFFQGSLGNHVCSKMDRKKMPFLNLHFLNYQDQARVVDIGWLSSYPPAF